MIQECWKTDQARR